MQKSIATFAAVGALVLNNPVLAQKPIASMTKEEIRSRIIELCKDPKIKKVVTGSKELCEISTDGGLTWKLAGGAAFAGFGAAYMIRRRKNGTDSAGIPETEPAGGPAPESDQTGSAHADDENTGGATPEAAPTGDTHTDDEPTGGPAPESDSRGGTDTEDESAGGSAPEAEYKTAQSKWENIRQDFRYSEKDAKNAKQVIRRLISRYSAGHGGSPTPEETADSAFLNHLMNGLKNPDNFLKEIAIKKIFAVAHLDELNNIPEAIV